MSQEQLPQQQPPAPRPPRPEISFDVEVRGAGSFTPPAGTGPAGPPPGR